MFDKPIAPKPEIVAEARINSMEEYERLYRLSLDDPETFWAKEAEKITCPDAVRSHSVDTSAPGHKVPLQLRPLVPQKTGFLPEKVLITAHPFKRAAQGPLDPEPHRKQLGILNVCFQHKRFSGKSALFIYADRTSDPIKTHAAPGLGCAHHKQNKKRQQSQVGLAV